jgi:ABC-type amino acid transport substrate-binding protein
MTMRSRRPYLAQWTATILSALFLFPTVGAAGSTRTVIQVMADTWCPYTCDVDAPQKGLFVDVVQLLLKDTEFDMNYRIVPWERVMAEGREGRTDIVLGMAAAEAHGDFDISTYSWDSPTCAYALDSSTKTLKSVPDLLNFKSIGLAKGYFYGEKADKFINTNTDIKPRLQYVGSTEPAGANFRKVVSNRIEIALEDPGVANLLVKSLNITGLKSVGCLPEVVKVFVGLPKKGKHYAKLSQTLQKRMAVVRKSGELDKVIRQYPLKP